jgi:ribosome-associated protein
MPVRKIDRKLRTLAVEAARLLDDRRCEDVRLLDVRGLSQVCDYVLIGSGTSARQMAAVAGELDELAQAHGEKLYRSSRDNGGTWIIIDFVDLVAHLFEPSHRAYYDLEGMWSDAKAVKWRRSAADGAAPRRRPSKRKDARPR